MDSLAGIIDSALHSTNSGNPSPQTNVALKKAALTLLGCYRTGEAHDPKVYITAVIAVLSAYPQDIIDEAVDPRCGIPGKIKWLPTIAEVKDFCEELAAPRRRAAEWDKRSAEQLAERKLLEDRRPKQTYEEFKAEMEARGLPVDKIIRKHIADEAAAFMAKHNLTQEQFDAIPNGISVERFDKIVERHRDGKRL